MRQLETPSLPQLEDDLGSRVLAFYTAKTVLGIRGSGGHCAMSPLSATTNHDSAMVVATTVSAILGMVCRCGNRY